MSTIKSSAENLTLNADGANNDIKFQSNGSEVASIDQAGLLTATSFAGNADDLHIKSPTGENMIKCVKDAQVNLYYNNAAKLSTSSTGVTVTGGVAIGGTGAANTLDDYEEGSFTPVLYGTTTDGTPSYTYQIGRYTKVGNIVHCTIRMTTSALGGIDGQMRIGGLPFTSLNVSDLFSPASCGYGAGLTVTAGNYVTGWIPVNLTYIRLTKWNSTVGTNYLGDADWSDTGSIMINCTYHVN